MRDSVGGGLAHSRGAYLGKTTPIRSEFRPQGPWTREKRARRRSQKAVSTPHRKEQSEPRSPASLRLTLRSGFRHHTPTFIDWKSRDACADRGHRDGLDAMSAREAKHMLH